jgi:ligand-binding SRPBCC domain-containing protein
MARIENTIKINAPVEAVFDYIVAEWEGTMSFFAGVFAWTPDPAKPMGDGFQFSYKVKLLGLPTKIEMVVRDFVKHQGWIAVSTRGPKTKGEWIFTPADNGTNFTYILNYKMPIPLLGGLLDSLIAKKQWEALIEKSLRNLTERIERHE